MDGVGLTFLVGTWGMGYLTQDKIFASQPPFPLTPNFRHCIQNLASSYFLHWAEER